MQSPAKKAFSIVISPRGLPLPWTLALLFTLVLVAGCGGGGGGGGAKVSTTFSGQVLDSAKGDAGVGGATVTIGGVTTQTTSTAAATATVPVGSFTIQNAAVGANSATITVPGQPAQTVVFAPALAAGANPAQQLFINIGQITGKVVLPTGAPAVNAFISIDINGDNVLTQPDGSFLIANVPVGTTNLSAVLGTASLSQAVTIGNGVTALGTLKLVNNPNPNPPGPPSTITGRVLLGGTGGGAVAGTNVFLLLNGNQIEVTTSDNAGGYSFYVPVGAYTLKFARNSYVSGSQDVAVSNPSVPVQVPDVTLAPQ